MGFAFVSPLTTQTGSYQSQVVTATNPTVDADTGTITAGSNWSTVRLGQAFAVVRGGAVVAVRCIASASGATLTYYRLYLESGEELPTNIQVGDTIEICEQPDLVGSGGVLSGNGATLTTTGNYLQYATGTTQIRVSGFFQLPTNQFLLPSPSVATAITTAALHTFTGGLLVLGEYVTRGGVSAFANEGLIRHPGVGGGVDSAFGIAINTCRGVHWFGGTFSGDRAMGCASQTNAPTTIYSKSAILKTVNLQTTSSYHFRTPNNLTTYGLTIDGHTLSFVGTNPNIGGLVVLRSIRPTAIGGPAPSNFFFPFRGAALKAGNLWYELAMWASKWYRIINHATGSDCRVGGNLFTTASPANRGLAEFRQEIRGTLLTKQRTAIPGAKIYIRDSNNGNRIGANSIGLNPSYLDDRTYYMTTNASGVFEYTTDGGVLTAVKYQNLANVAVSGFGGVVEDYRSPSNSNEDLFDYHMVAYGYLPLSLSANFKGTVAKDLSTTLDADTDIAESSLSTVLAYTEIDTQAKFYDRAQAWLTESSANQELPGLGNQLVTLANNTLQLGARNLVVDATATSAFAVTSDTITIKASTLTANVKTTGTVTLANGATVNGVILDANSAGAISVTGVGVSDTAEMRRASDNSLIASRTGSGAFSVSPTNVGVSVYFVRLVGSNIVMSTITTPVTLTAGVNSEVAMFAGAEVQVAQVPEVLEINNKVDLLAVDIEAVKGVGFNTSTDALAVIRVAIGSPFQADDYVAPDNASVMAMAVRQEIERTGGMLDSKASQASMTALATANQTEHDATQAAIAALPAPLTATQTRAQVDAALTAYDAVVPADLATLATAAQVTAIGAPLQASSYTAPPSATSTAQAVRAELATELGRMDAAVSSRLPTSAYTTPPSAAEIATQVEIAILNEDDGRQVIEAIADKIKAEEVTAGVIAATVRTEIKPDLQIINTGVKKASLSIPHTGNLP